MSPIDILAIEQEARKRRAEEMQRVSGLLSAQLRVYAKLLAATALQGLIALGEIIRPLFAWNPRARRSC